MTQADHIIGKAGSGAEGVTTLARWLGHKHRTTVQGWQEKGFIPLKNWGRIIKVYTDHEIEISRADFLEHLDLEVAA